LSEFIFEIVDEGRLVVGICGAVGVKDEDAVGFYEDAEVE
jgi:hypothetical protein